MERMDALVARKDKDGKTHWTKVGVAFPTKSGGGWNVYLDALPVDGNFSLFPPKPKEAKGANSSDSDPDDELTPF